MSGAPTAATNPKPAPMSAFATMLLSAAPTTVAPDGSGVRPLLSLPGVSMAHFELGAGGVARAVTHRTVAEVWFVVSGRGEMWRPGPARGKPFQFQVPGRLRRMCEWK